MLGSVVDLPSGTINSVASCCKVSEFIDHGYLPLDKKLMLLLDRYKGMAASATVGKTPSRGSTLTPQSTGAGFSQMGGRPGAQNESSGAAMSVLLSWHEKVVDIAGLGSVNRSMTDWRKV